MEDPSNNSVEVEPLPTHQIDAQSSTEDEHNVVDSDQTSMVSVVYVGQDTWVTDFDKMEVSKKIMERLSTIDAPAVQDPALDDICAGKDPTDSRWYRVKVVSLQPAVTVLYIDFGNESEISPENLAVLPDELKLEPALAKKATLRWDNPCCPEVVPAAGDVLQVKYDGKEADGTLKFEVLAVKGIDHDEGEGEGLSDEEKSEEHILSVHIQSEKDEHGHGQVNNGNGTAGTAAPKEDGSQNGSQDGLQDGGEFDSFPVSVDQIQGVEAASSLREEAHTVVQEILQKLDEGLPKQDEVAMQTRLRLEVEKSMEEIGNRLPLQEEVAIQTRKEVQKIMEGLDERLQKQQEAALASMRQMMEKALAQSLNKIDKIQKDLHKLYATSKQQQQQQHRTSNDAEASYQRNQYNRPITRNPNAPPPPHSQAHEFSPDKRHQNKFARDDDRTLYGGTALGSNNTHMAGAGAGAGVGAGAGASPAGHGGNMLMSPRLGMGMGMGLARPMRDPNSMQSFHAMRDGNSMQVFSSMRDEGAMRDGNSNIALFGQSPSPSSSQEQGGQGGQGGNSRRSVSLRLKQAGAGAGDMHPVTSSILSVNNLPEVFTCEYLCTLFGLYGNVVRAKLLFNQKGKALVEMADAAQAAATTRQLDGAVMFGQSIHVRPSTFEKLNISPTEIANSTAKDHTRLNSYQANSVRRFRKGFWDPARLVPPSATLRVSNILKTVPDEKVGAAFTDKGFEYKSIHFHQGSADKKSAFVVFSSTEDAFRALHELHNYELSDWMPMKISFGVSK